MSRNKNALPKSDPNTTSDQNSLIESYLDQYGISVFLNNSFEKFPIKTTKISRQAIILFIFLLFVFNSAHLLALDFSIPMISLYGLILIILIDLIPRNSSHLGYFKKYLFSEEKNRVFLDNLCKYRNNDIEHEIRLRDFSSSTICYFLEKIRSDPNKYHEFIIETVLQTSRLSPENLDQIFTEEILSHLREKFIIRLLIKYQNQLSQKNLEVLYYYIKSNDRLVRLLIATQNQSESICKKLGNEEKLKKYYEQFQLEKTPEFVNYENKLHYNNNTIWMVISLSSLTTVFLIIICVAALLGMPILTNGIINPWILFICFIAMLISVIPARKLYRRILNQQNNDINKFVEYVSNYA
jgi:energy-coupling factor transporter transmembrane protein EcfT